MLIECCWPDDAGEAPVAGDRVEVSGDPDQLVLSGIVAVVEEDEDVVLKVLMPDGQPGAQAFMDWVMTAGNIGVRRAGVKVL